MSHTMKLYERIIEKRVRGETLVGDEQFGFMPGRSTTDAIFALRERLKKYGEKQRELHLIFIYLEKAYDRVPRQEVWASIRRKVASEKYVRVIQDIYLDHPHILLRRSFPSHTNPNFLAWHSILRFFQINEDKV